MFVGASTVIIYSILTRPNERNKSIRRIDKSGIYLTDQLKQSDFPRLRQISIETIVDLRPDGESLDQPSSKVVEQLSKHNGIVFDYIPVPHGEIPADRIDKLSSVLENGKRPILLYCRTGKRALRTFCLAEAGRKKGHTLDEMKTMSEISGFDIEDLLPQIKRRIALTRIIHEK